MTLSQARPIFESIPNFRDVGGLTLSGRGVIAPGRLYRSQMLRGFSDAERARLGALGLAMVYDLRGPDERATTPHAYLSDATRVRAADGGGNLSAVRITQWRERLLRPEFDAAAAHAALIDNYERMPAALGPELADLCRILAAAPAGPVLVHCSVGKDRTGFVIATLLRAIGVQEEMVMTDYLASGPLLADQQEMLTHYREELFGGLPAHAEPALQAMLSTHPDFLGAARRVIDARYGGLSAYLAAHDIDQALLEAVADYLVAADGAERA